MTASLGRGPAPLSSAIAMLAALVPLFATAFASTAAVVAGTIGYLAVGVGLWLSHRRAVTLGAAVLFLGVLWTGVAGTGGGVLLWSIVATVVAWDAGHTAISVGAQVGPEAETAGVEVVRLLACLLVGTGSITLGYTLFRLVGGTRTVPVLGVTAGLAAAFAFVYLLDTP